MKKKLQLEILDPTGNVVVSHNFDYEAGQDNKLRLAITDNVYIMDSNGKLVILTQEEIDKETNRKENSVGKKEPRYFNPKTKKIEKLFDEKNLIPVFTVGCTCDNVVSGDKGCAVYFTTEAQDMEAAKDKAMLNPHFMSHIRDVKNFDRKYLSVHVPQGNYVIGRVWYFEGDERL